MKRVVGAIICLGAAILLLFFVACSEPEVSSSSDGSKVGVEKNSEAVSKDNQSVDTGRVIATVNEQPIVDDDVDFFMAKRLNVLPHQQLDTRIRTKVLDSLVASKAMALMIESQLGSEELAEIERQVAFYREELLTKRYLQDHADPQPVSHAMVQQYYEEHPEEFGGKRLKTIEWVATLNEVDDRNDKAVMDLFTQLGKNTVGDTGGWEAPVKALNASAPKVSYKAGSFSMALLPPRIADLVKRTEVGETSGIHVFDKKMHRLRVIGVKEVPGKPLSEVSHEIRKKLAPMQMRDAVKLVTKEALEKVDVKYIDETTS